MLLDFGRLAGGNFQLAAYDYGQTRRFPLGLSNSMLLRVAIQREQRQYFASRYWRGFQQWGHFVHVADQVHGTAIVSE